MIGSARRLFTTGLSEARPALTGMFAYMVQRYRISGSHLDMLDARGAAIARFEAMALR